MKIRCNLVVNKDFEIISLVFKRPKEKTIDLSVYGNVSAQKMPILLKKILKTGGFLHFLSVLLQMFSEDIERFSKSYITRIR